MAERVKQVQHIKVFGCGHKIITSTFQVPERHYSGDIIEDVGEGSLCAPCLTQQWEENRKQGFSIRDIFHSVLKEEDEGKEGEEDSEEVNQ